MLVFASDGRLVASTEQPADGPWASVSTVSELEARYRHSDGMPIELRRRGRHVGIPVDGHGPRMTLVSEPLAATDRAAPVLVVTVGAFQGEDDGATVQRALSSVLAHELRTPMTTVYGGAELLMRPALAEHTRLEAASSVAHAAEQLHRVVEDLIVLVRRGPERVEYTEPVLLQPIVRAAVQRAGGSDAAIDLDAAPGIPPVVATPPLVEHLARNLLAHAIANSPPGARVAVELRDGGAEVQVAVSDEGPTRDDEERQHAFDLFAPTSRQSADPSGANLALVATRLIVERLGGRIEAGRPERGGQTIVTLPAVREPAGAGPL